jgi:valine--pyruvate aminotransferase
MELSAFGTQMVRPSGVTTILNDIASARVAGGEWLNLSAGNPARIPEVTSAWQRWHEEVAADGFGDRCCQYGPARGSESLVDAIARYFNARYGWNIGPENIVVGPGSQMLSFIATTLFTGPSRRGQRYLALPCVPDYAGYQGLCLDEANIVAFEPKLEVRADGLFTYGIDIGRIRDEASAGMILLSSPCNPSGRSITPAERSDLVEMAADNDIALVIDNAYGAPFPQIAAPALDPTFHPNVINFFTVSKAGLPGERIAFAIGSAERVGAMVAVLANSALHAPQLMQAVVARALNGGELDNLVSAVISPHYRAKRAMAETLLRELLPESVGWRLHVGAGGMFCWLWIEETWFDDLAFYSAVKRKGVFVVPGRYFFVEPFTSPFLLDHGTRCIRLSLSAPEEALGEGIGRIAEALREMSMKASTTAAA